MITFNDHLRCYNNNKVVSTLEAMQNMIKFYQNKGRYVETGMHASQFSKYLLKKTDKSQVLPVL